MSDSKATLSVPPVFSAASVTNPSRSPHFYSTFTNVSFSHIEDLIVKHKAILSVEKIVGLCMRKLSTRFKITGNKEFIVLTPIKSIISVS